MDIETGAARILIVEDSPVIAIAAEEMLRGFGHVPVGPAGTMAGALEMAEGEAIDAAIVDLNIRGSKTFSVLAILEKRGIPFLIISGYANWAMPDEWAGHPRLQKPFDEEQLRSRLADILPRG